MIARLSSPSAATAVFAADELPEAVHDSVLQGVVIPRVASWSMTPTIMKGDRLELERTDTFQVGDVVVYRHDQLFVCHRIQRIDGSHLYLRGDTSCGPVEQIRSCDVVGRVTTLLRDGGRLAVPPYERAINQPTGHSVTHRYAAASYEQGRSLILRLIAAVATLPLVGWVLRLVLGRIVSIDLLEQAPLQSITGYMNRRHFRLCQTDRFETHVSGPNTDLSRIILVIRAGPLHLGACSLQPWNLQIRPLATALGLESSFQPFRSFLTTIGPL